MHINNITILKTTYAIIDIYTHYQKHLVKHVVVNSFNVPKMVNQPSYF